ncbi:MAG: hypothetical protein H5T44_05990 [Thermoplasmatales archaeon]|nr:hypothetical protein [Thermoplasmatales archaeon]
MEISIGISCPSCGGALNVEEGKKVISCRYCDALIWLEGDEGVYTVMFANNVTKEKAISLLNEWFGKKLKARDLKRRAEITEIFPIYLPFWRMKARSAGWVCGYREERHYDAVRKTTTVKKVPMEKMVFRDFDWTQIACDAGDIGVKYLRNLQGNTINANADQIPTFEVTTSKSDAINLGIEKIRQEAIKSAGVENITFQKMHVIPKSFMLIYYPVWIARYKYKERMYFATIDGVTSKVIAGRAPGDALYQAMIMTGGAILGGIISSLGIWTIGSSTGLGIFALIGGFIIFIASYMFFRHGSEIVEGDIEKKYGLPLESIKNIKNIRIDAPGNVFGGGKI